MSSWCRSCSWTHTDLITSSCGTSLWHRVREVMSLGMCELSVRWHYVVTSRAHSVTHMWSICDVMVRSHDFTVRSLWYNICNITVLDESDVTVSSCDLTSWLRRTTIGILTDITWLSYMLNIWDEPPGQRNVYVLQARIQGGGGGGKTAPIFKQ